MNGIFLYSRASAGIVIVCESPAPGPQTKRTMTLAPGSPARTTRAFVGFAAADAQLGLPDAVRLGRIELHPRAMLADIGPLGIHFDSSLRPDRLERFAKEAPEEGIRGRRRGCTGNRVCKFSIGQDLGPHLRRCRFHIAAKDHWIDRRATHRRIDPHLDDSLWNGEPFHLSLATPRLRLRRLQQIRVDSLASFSPPAVSFEFKVFPVTIILGFAWLELPPNM